MGMTRVKVLKGLGLFLAEPNTITDFHFTIVPLQEKAFGQAGVKERLPHSPSWTSPHPIAFLQPIQAVRSSLPLHNSLCSFFATFQFATLTGMCGLWLLLLGEPWSGTGIAWQGFWREQEIFLPLKLRLHSLACRESRSPFKFPRFFSLSSFFFI